jgi:hypothetical protein
VTSTLGIRALLRPSCPIPHRILSRVNWTDPESGSITKCLDAFTCAVNQADRIVSLYLDLDRNEGQYRSKNVCYLSLLCAPHASRLRCRHTLHREFDAQNAAADSRATSYRTTTGKFSVVIHQFAMGGPCQPYPQPNLPQVDETGIRSFLLYDNHHLLYWHLSTLHLYDVDLMGPLDADDSEPGSSGDGDIHSALYMAMWFRSPHPDCTAIKTICFSAGCKNSEQVGSRLRGLKITVINETEQIDASAGSWYK